MIKSYAERGILFFAARLGFVREIAQKFVVAWGSLVLQPLAHGIGEVSMWWPFGLDESNREIDDQSTPVDAQRCFARFRKRRAGIYFTKCVLVCVCAFLTLRVGQMACMSL